MSNKDFGPAIIKASVQWIFLIPAAIALLCIFISVALIAQELSYVVRVIDICVPVRVFAGDQFVDNLAKKDFAVYEDGELQEVESVYFVKGAKLESKETPTAFEPSMSRSFFLFFSMYEYDAQIPKALSYFFEKIAGPSDKLMVITPKAVYDLKKDAVGRLPPEKIVVELTRKIRKDIMAGDAVYRSVLADLRRIVGAGGIGEQMTDSSEMTEDQQMSQVGEGTIEEFLMKYRSDVDRLEQLRTIDEGKFLEFAKALKRTEGQKVVFYFYQKEFVPLLNMATLQKHYQNILVQSLISDMVNMLNRRSTFDVDRIKKTFADSSISVHFLYLAKNPAEIPLNQIGERRDIVSTFDEIVASTGGSSVRSSSVSYLMEKAASAAENYYLLYYSPKDKKLDGRFRQIRVEVKAGSYRVFHKAGYFAD
jgi:hypothetical protein